MALILKDRISETTTTTGTGTLTLDGALLGFQPFSSIGDTNTTYYCITDTTAWEVGLGTYSSSGNTLARTTVLSNSNGNTSPITLAAGTKTVFSVYPAERAIVVNGSTIQIPNSAVLPLANGGTGSSTAAFSGSNITDLNATAITAGTISNARTTASSSNGASTIVERDATGNFSTNVITANSYSGSGANLTSLNASSVSSGTLSAANGGTGQTSLTANNVILGNTTSAVQFVAPGTSANVLTSNGTTWVSQAAAGGGSSYTILTAQFMSGASFLDFTSIPTTAKQIVISVHFASTTAGGIPIVRVGNGGSIVTSLYNPAQVSVAAGASAGLANTTGFLLNNSGVAGNIVSGTATFTKLGDWIYSYQAMWGTVGGTGVNIRTMLSSGSVDMGNTFVGGLPITTIRMALTTVDTFDSGVMSVAYLT
jgi:hypothetical protein